MHGPASRLITLSALLLQRWWLIGSVSLALMLPACSAQPGALTEPKKVDMEATTEPQKTQGTEYYIKDTTQLTVDTNLRIGAGNIWEEAYAAEDGQQVEGLTAGLWFFVRQQPELNHHVRVHPGQTVEVATYRIDVLSVDQQGVRINLVP